jgi:hypothetical protein
VELNGEEIAAAFATGNEKLKQKKVDFLLEEEVLDE